MQNNEEFEGVAKLYMDSVFRVAYGYLKCSAEADDATQNALIKLYRCDRAFESDAHIKNWLMRVVINECKKTLLSPWRRVEPIEDYAASLSFMTPEHSELFLAVMELPKKYRAAILLHYYEGYSTAEIGELLGIPRATVFTHLKRGREMLKTRLLEAGYDAR